jgi:hypothetical protein
MNSFPLRPRNKLQTTMCKGIQKRKISDAGQPIDQKRPRISTEDQSHSQNTQSMLLNLLYNKKKSKSKDGLYQFVLWRENFRKQREYAFKSVFI